MRNNENYCTFRPLRHHHHHHGVKEVKQSRYKPGGFQEVKVPKFHDNGTGWW
jgi:hypothetical protein